MEKVLGTSATSVLTACLGAQDRSNPRNCFLPSETPRQGSRNPLPFVPCVLGALDFLWDGLFLPRSMGSQLADVEEGAYMYNMREELSDQKTPWTGGSLPGCSAGSFRALKGGEQGLRSVWV